MKIEKIHAREILDSRGYPTVEATVILENGISGTASVPSGASTGSKEAIELRDGDKSRFRGKGVLRAVENVNTEISRAIKGVNVDEQQKIDNKLIELDGTKNKARLGANAILAASLACAHADANYKGIPLFSKLASHKSYTMPVPMMNIINGGAHADNQIDIQEFMIMPVNAPTMRDAIRMGSEVFHCLKEKLITEGLSTNVGDEGGFAPNLSGAKQAMDLILNAIMMAGYKPGEDIYLALDIAASEFYKDGKYHLKGEGRVLNAEEIIEYYDNLIRSYPILSIEDPMSEHDNQGWIDLTEELGERVQIVGDDLFVTNEAILREGIASSMANAILIKPNQIGTLTETFSAISTANEAGYNSIISHRSAETEDVSIAHIAVASGCGQIKTGSLCRTDRIAKYNELIRIEETLGDQAAYINPVKHR